LNRLDPFDLIADYAVIDQEALAVMIKSNGL